jgi:hypothetical protein
LCKILCKFIFCLFIIILVICLSILSFNTSLAEISSEFVETQIKDKVFLALCPLESSEQIESLKRELEKEKLIFEFERIRFMDKVQQTTNLFESYTFRVEFHTPSNHYEPKVPDNISIAQKDVLNSLLAKIRKEVRIDVVNLLNKHSKIESLDSKIHDLTKTEYSKEEYNNLRNILSKYQDPYWFIKDKPLRLTHVHHDNEAST